MLYKLNIILGLFLLTVSCSSHTKEHVYENSLFRVILKEQCKKLIRIKLINLHNDSIYSALPELMVYDDGIPIEGGIVDDYNKIIDNDIDPYNMDSSFSCDSIYCIVTDSIHLVFGQESRSYGQNKPTNRRLYLGICNSELSSFVEGYYTLYAVKE